MAPRAAERVLGQGHRMLPAGRSMGRGVAGVVWMGRTRGIVITSPLLVVARNASGSTARTQLQATALKRGRARVLLAKSRPVIAGRVNMTTWVVVPGIIAQARRARKSYEI